MPAAIARSAIALPTAWAASWLPPVLQLAGQLLVLRRRGRQRLAGQIVDDLDGNVLVAADDAKPRPLGRAANALADAKRATLPQPT